jgi:hypothetical protein
LSFGSLKVLGGIQEVLVLGLMIVFVLTIFYVDISWTYKLGIGILTFAIIFLAVTAASILMLQREIKKNQA